MNCSNCGAIVPEGTKYCPNCGTEQAFEQPQYEGYEAQTATQPNVVSSTPVLVWGILGLAFACSFYFSILGIIFSGVAKKLAKKYVATYGVLTGKARVGKNLATAGLIVGIIFTVLLVFTLDALIASYQ